MAENKNNNNPREEAIDLEGDVTSECCSISTIEDNVSEDSPKHQPKGSTSNILHDVFSTITNFGNKVVHPTGRSPTMSELISHGDHMSAAKEGINGEVATENIDKSGILQLRMSLRSRSNSLPPKSKLQNIIIPRERKTSKTTFYLSDDQTVPNGVDETMKPQSEEKPLPSFKRRKHTTQLAELIITQPWRRLVEKHGDCNVHYTKIKKRSMYFLMDIFTTVIEMRWRYILVLFFASFNITWLLFAFVWWGIAVAHGDDLEFANSTCVVDVTDFNTAFLFSLETMHTIGYGTRAMTDECPIAIFILILQACFGVFMQSIMTGVVLAKIARPKWRGHTIMFSKYAVINKTFDNKLSLQFRLGDMRRKSQLISAIIRAIVVEKVYTNDGQARPLNQRHFSVTTETGSDFLLMTWPVIILHEIDENSFLYNMTPDEMFSAKFEIIVILEGTIETTGMSAQYRTSYLPSEIVWGERLAPLISYNKAGRYMIDHTKFHATEEIYGKESGLDLSEHDIYK